MEKFLLFITLSMLVTCMLVSWMVFLCSFSKKSIIPIRTFKDVDFNTITKDSLVIFDVDETLVQPQDTFLINEHTPEGVLFKRTWGTKYPDIPRMQWEEIGSIMLTEAPRPLIEPEVIHEIQHLLKRGVTVMACSQMYTGSYGICSSLEQWRYEHLTSLGLKTSFDDLIMNVEGQGKPIFYRGILCTDREIPGPGIGALLDRLNLDRQQVVMFDDRLDFLVSTQKECKKRGIRFKGYHYQGARQKEWNESIVQFQADYLVKHKKWIPDEEVSKLISNGIDSIEQPK